MFEKNDKKQETPQRNLRRFLYWGEPKKEHFVLRDITLRFIFSERFVLRIIHNNNKNAHSSLFLYDASYVRLKNIEIGYSLPYQLIKIANLQQVRFYIQGQNLLTWDKLGDVDVDPETNSNGTWYPIQKVFNFGVNITF